MKEWNDKDVYRNHNMLLKGYTVKKKQVDYIGTEEIA